MFDNVFKNYKMSKVSRSVYQKAMEENKRLKNDIRVLVEGDIMDCVNVKIRWQQIFKKETEFNNLMKQFAVDYFEKHPEHDVVNKVSGNINEGIQWLWFCGS